MMMLVALRVSLPFIHTYSHKHAIKIKCYSSFQLQNFLVLPENYFIATDLYNIFMWSVVDVNIVILNINKSPRTFIDDLYINTHYIDIDW